MASQRIDTKKILSREISRAAVQSYTKQAAPVLAKVVDEGIAVFERCSSTAIGGDENLGILFPALHVFELIDGVDILLRDAAVIPAHVLLRAAFETKLSVEYVTERDTKRRGAAYVVADIHRRIQNWQRWDPNTQHGKQLRAEMRKDRHGRAISIPAEPESATAVGGFQALLKKDHLREAAEEYERVRKRTRKHPAFHALWGGPAGIQDLARHLERGGQYEILYRHWSNTSHGVDLQRQLTHNEGIAAVRVFRDPSAIASAYVFAITFGLEAIRALLRCYRPAEIDDGSHAKWYVRDIQRVYQALGRVGRDENGNGGGGADPVGARSDP